MPLRETRRFKTKGFVISFGDLMLPLVGLVAIGLLVVAGKIFFFSSQANSQPIPVSVAPPDTPRRAGASEAAAPPSPAQTRPQAPLARGNISRDNAGAAPVAPRPDSASQDSAGPKIVREEVNTKPAPAAVSTPRPAAPKPEARTPPKPATPARAAVVVVSQPQPARPRQAQQVWKVQVGAYSTKGAADSVVKTLAQTGHTAAVVPGKLHKVLVQAGATRQDAARLASRFDQSGYPGAFIVAP